MRKLNTLKYSVVVTCLLSTCLLSGISAFAETLTCSGKVGSTTYGISAPLVLESQDAEAAASHHLKYFALSGDVTVSVNGADVVTLPEEDTALEVAYGYNGGVVGATTVGRDNPAFTISTYGTAFSEMEGGKRFDRAQITLDANYADGKPNLVINNLDVVCFIE